MVCNIQPEGHGIKSCWEEGKCNDDYLREIAEIVSLL